MAARVVETAEGVLLQATDGSYFISLTNGRRVPAEVQVNRGAAPNLNIRLKLLQQKGQLAITVREHSATVMEKRPEGQDLAVAPGQPEVKVMMFNDLLRAAAEGKVVSFSETAQVLEKRNGKLVVASPGSATYSVKDPAVYMKEQDKQSQIRLAEFRAEQNKRLEEFQEASTLRVAKLHEDNETTIAILKEDTEKATREQELLMQAKQEKTNREIEAIQAHAEAERNAGEQQLQRVRLEREQHVALVKKENQAARDRAQEENRAKEAEQQRMHQRQMDQQAATAQKKKAEDDEALAKELKALDIKIAKKSADAERQHKAQLTSLEQKSELAKMEMQVEFAEQEEQRQAAARAEAKKRKEILQSQMDEQRRVMSELEAQKEVESLQAKVQLQALKREGEAVLQSEQLKAALAEQERQQAHEYSRRPWYKKVFS